MHVDGARADVTAVCPADIAPRATSRVSSRLYRAQTLAKKQRPLSQEVRSLRSRHGVPQMPLLPSYRQASWTHYPAPIPLPNPPQARQIMQLWPKWLSSCSGRLNNSRVASKYLEISTILGVMSAMTTVAAEVQEKKQVRERREGRKPLDTPILYY